MKAKKLFTLLIICIVMFAMAGCTASEEDVIGTYKFLGGWYGIVDEGGDGERVFIGTTMDGEETFPNVTAIPEGIDGFMNKAAFYVEITDKKIIEHGSIQYSGNKFLVNHSIKKEYSYTLKRQKNNKNAFDIYDENGNNTYFEVWENSLTYNYYYGDGNMLCLSYRRG
ncbi:MAG: hypothetical protein K2M89_03350 [Clostridiales bacterium]|nr:hypothetical protein [Clostridiales bacterium]